jgi:hypothetical protein
MGARRRGGPRGGCFWPKAGRASPRGTRRSAPGRRILLVVALALALVVQPLPEAPGGGLGLPRLDLAGPWKAAASLLGSGPALVLKGIRGVGGLFSGQVRAETAPAPSPSASSSGPAVGTVASDSPQELPSLRTETAKFFRMPDGSHVAEVYPGPIHYRDAQGYWQDIDTTLVPSTAPGFAWQNRAGSFSARFAASAGGSAVEEVADGPRRADFGLAGASPSTGTVTGSTITYSGVLPGVDVRFEVRADSIKELIVLTQRPASALAVRFPLSLSGLTARQDRTGGVSLLDASGTARFLIPRAWATDSAIDPHTGLGAFMEVPIILDTSGAAPALVVSPDPTWLADPARVYPVVIDPSVNKTTTGDTFVQSNIANTPQGSSTELRAGTYDGSTKARSLLAFSMSGLAGTQILSATLKLYEFWSWSCSARQVNVYRVTSSWSESSTVWGTQPSINGTAVDSVNAAKGYSSSCPAGWISFDVTSPVSAWVAGTSTNYGLEVRAASETDTYGWKKFDSREASHPPYLAITYNHPPAVPTLESPVGSNPTPTVRTVVPVLKANSTDADGDPLDYQFQVATDSGFTSVAATSPWLPTTNTWTVPPGKLKDGQTYYWRARARDDWYTTGWSTGQPVYVRVLKLGSSPSWPMWSHGPLQVNRANGNLVLSVPGPSYPTAAGSMGASATFNSLDGGNRGLGTGWVLDVGEELASPPRNWSITTCSPDRPSSMPPRWFSPRAEAPTTRT